MIILIIISVIVVVVEQKMNKKEKKVHFFKILKSCLIFLTIFLFYERKKVNLYL